MRYILSFNCVNIRLGSLVFKFELFGEITSCEKKYNFQSIKSSSYLLISYWKRQTNKQTNKKQRKTEMENGGKYVGKQNCEVPRKQVHESAVESE